jgi:7-cyano-7-deazaguanine tRNA-ribosyltransferase
MENLRFEIKKLDAGGRLGIIKKGNKKMVTPNLFPVVSPFNNIIPPQDIIDVFGGEAVFTNAYILYKNKEAAQNAKIEGLHNFINFKDGLIATDSGAFQHYMYGGDGDITPREIETFQEEIGSDFPVILDLPVQLDDSREKAEYKVTETIKRANNNVSRRNKDDTAWIGPIHGGKYLDLVRKSCKEMNQLDFGIYAIGGIVKTLNDYMFEISINILLTAKRFLRPDRPVHLFGAGLPQFFALAVACGVDTMDSAAYILFAKEGRYFTLTGTKNITDLYELPCNCPICSKYSATEIKQLYRTDLKRVKGETEKKNGIELIARHNLYVSFGELRRIREAIRTGMLWELVEQRIHTHPKLMKAYQQIPKFWPQLELLEPIQKPRAVFLYGDISRSRPIFYRVAQRIFSNFSMESNKNLVILPELDTSAVNSPTTKKWIRLIEEKNKNIIKSKKISDSFEIIIISNNFGPIPYKLVNIYPFSQREWIQYYSRTNSEIYSLLKYQHIIPENLFRIRNEEIEFNNRFLKFLIEDKDNEDKNNHIIPEFGEIVYNINQDLKFSDIINRIELCLQFFKKHKSNINSITFLRPENYISENGNETTLKSHLIDDIIQILSKNNEVLRRNSEVRVLSSLQEL